MRRLGVAVLAVATFALALTGTWAAPAAAAVPAGFSDELVTGVGAPTALAFTPDGRMLITTQPGTLRVFQNGSLVATPAVDLAARLCSNSERACWAWPSIRASPPTATCSCITRSTGPETAGTAP